LVALAPDVILAAGTNIVGELTQVTHTVPDLYVAALAPAQFLQRLSEGGEPGLIFWVVLGAGQKNTDAPFTIRLLGAHSDRPSDGSSNSFNEITSPHCQPQRLRARHHRSGSNWQAGSGQNGA
jgi:hypothetical protein